MAFGVDLRGQDLDVRDSPDSKRFRLLLPAVLAYLLKEGVVDLVTPDLAQRLTLGEDHTVVLAARYPVVGVPGFARTVDDAAHDRHREVVLEVLEPLLDPRRHPDDVETQRASATRAGDDVGA